MEVVQESAARILYVEPNDVFDSTLNGEELVKLNGASITPKYEDLCISFNLIIDQFSRLRKSGQSNSINEQSNENKVVTIEWFTTISEMEKKKDNGFSIMSGEEGNGGHNNFLTTYYTDLSFDSYKQKTQIEGLGVESVEISYESWYTPTVVIKFVDVRGSAIFGREEAIHNIEEDMTVDNIFGAFFTMPYPRFRLQVKGFYGKPVTFQLTCESFKGQLNSKTGNFEANVRFIAYSWSLLTEIPFMYLVAASNAPYIGADYWDRHKNDPEWQLWDKDGNTIQPLKLDEMFENIRNATNFIDDKISKLNQEESERNAQIDNELTTLDEISKKQTQFINDVATLFEKKYINSKDGQGYEQYIFFSDTENIEINNEVKISFEELVTLINNYTSTQTKALIPASNKPNDWDSSVKLPSTFNCSDFLDISGNEYKIKHQTTNNVKDFTFNDNQRLNSNLSDIISNDIVKKADYLKQYAFVINVFDYKAQRIDLNNQYAKDIQEQYDKINALSQDEISELIGFRPYIGNVFRIIFCHVETLCHMLFDSADEIYQQMARNERTRAVLGIGADTEDFKRVDFKNVDNIGPWPALFNEDNQDTGYQTIKPNVYAWCGDLSHNFIEEKVVYALQEGIERMVDRLGEEETQGGLYSYNFFPISPLDFVNRTNPFNAAKEVSIDTLAGYLSMRTALFFIGNNAYDFTKDFKTLGKIDAFNYYIANGTVSKIKQTFEKFVEGRKPEDILYEIALCEKNEDNQKYCTNETDKYSFETIKTGENSRHPMFTEDGNFLNLTHWKYNAKGMFFLPSKLRQDFVKYHGDGGLKKDSEHNGCIIPQIHPDGTAYEWLCTFPTSKLTFITDKTKYINKNMFGIITDSTQVRAIENRIKSLKEETLTAVDYEVKEDVKNAYVEEIVEKRLKVFPYKNDFTTRCLAPKVSFVEQKIIDFDDPNKLNTAGYAMLTMTEEYDVKKFSLSINDTNYDISFEDILITRFLIDYDELFMHPFFYLQNEIEDNKERINAKAILFLHTFFCNYQGNILNFLKIDYDIVSIPKALILFYGCLCWWKRQRENNKTIVKFYKDFYEDPGKKNTLISNDKLYDGSDVYTCASIMSKNYRSFSSILGEYLDINIENQLIKLYEEFVDKDFPTILRNLEILDAGNNNKPFTFNAFIKFKQNYLDYDSNKNQKTSSKNTVEIAKGITEYVAFIAPYFNSKYQSCKCFNDNLIRLLISDNNPALPKLRSMYIDYYVVYNLHDESNDGTIYTISIRPNLFKDYLSGFCETVKEIIDANTINVGGEFNGNVSETTYGNTELSISIYYYIKNLWDKWLCPSYSDAFDVKNFFNKNFIFIDSFYRNTSNKLAIDCQVLLDAFMRLEENASLFSFIGKVINKHKCILMPVPDYVGFNNDKRDANVKCMNELFRPMPFNNIPQPSNSNKFVCIYTHNPAIHASETNLYPNDSYNIWNAEEGSITSIAKELFSVSKRAEEQGDTVLATNYGYYVPSFGVAFGRQFNHLFKDMKISMENPVMTEQSIIAQWNIAMKGSASGKSICFTGQDTYNIFTNYSYSVDIEMMGNVQICPLMYFQLLNVPMWRGTYMIYKVTHSMRPGDMTTRFTGMKMSKHAKPFNTNFYTIVKSVKTQAQGITLLNDCDDENNTVTAGSGYTGNVTNENAKKVLSYVPYYMKSNTVYATAGHGRRNNYKDNIGKQITINGQDYKINSHPKGDAKGSGDCAFATGSRFTMANVVKSISFWGGKRDYMSSVSTEVIKNLEPSGFTLVYHNNIENGIKYCDNKQNVRPCDVAVLLVYSGKQKHVHACMWDGENWVSDFVQGSVNCYSGDVSDRDGSYSICLFRHPDVQESGMTVVKVN